MQIRILVVDDERSLCRTLEIILGKEGYDVVSTQLGAHALSLIYEQDFNVIFTDLNLPDTSGLDIITEARKRIPCPQVILITAFASIETAVDAIKRGAYDYLTKPLSPDKVRVTTRRAIEKLALTAAVDHLRQEVSQCFGFDNMVGKSQCMYELRKTILYAAKSTGSVVITGESGTGKELVARAIHYNSNRKDNPFVPVNCAAISKDLIESELFGYVKGAFTGALRDKVGFIELSGGGSLFLDEIGETAPSFQVKLLRVIQNGEFNRVGEASFKMVDTRFIAATNRDLKKAIADGSFREDLFYRLHVISIHLPPLRDRREDVPLLAIHFLNKYSRKYPDKGVSNLTPEATEALSSYDYPGNVRELENAIEHALVFGHGDSITVDALPATIRDRAVKSSPTTGYKPGIKPLKIAKYEFERALITSALIQSEGNISRAARLLDIHRQNLQLKIKEFDIDVESLK
ncbi:MAG: sigma-54-dependent Fis family transcriptional regulator [Nitrospirae bacterium]|nr:sigma-54-dependent Fis family transcriptional regulator [Nitrospirota bacterium]MBF0591428.1 sigma-54-dependent Fis family transcriptional regulator [Nitrospirota bacterium]